MCDDCHNRNSDSSFIFGIVIGAIIGAFVAVYVYKNNRSRVFTDLKKKLTRYFSDFMKDSPAASDTPKQPQKITLPKLEKKTVVIPKNIETIDLKPIPKRKPAKMFKK